MDVNLGFSSFCSSIVPSQKHSHKNIPKEGRSTLYRQELLSPQRCQLSQISNFENPIKSEPAENDAFPQLSGWRELKGGNCKGVIAGEAEKEGEKGRTIVIPRIGWHKGWNTEIVFLVHSLFQ